MAVFSKSMNPPEGRDIKADLRRIGEHIAYMQEAIEFSSNRQDRKLKALDERIEAVEERIEAVEKAAKKEAETHGNP